jgi:hypothetical protein
MAANEARNASSPGQARPAIGGGDRQPRKVLIWQGAIGLLLVVLMLGAKQAISGRETGTNPLAAFPGGNQLTAGLDIGGAPTDIYLTGLAGSYGVDGVINLAAPSVGEQATCAYLHLSYLHVNVAAGAAPTLAALLTMANFLRGHTSGGSYVYLHDQGGGAGAVSAASMLLLMKGESWQTVQKALTAGELASLSSAQVLAIADLTSALDDQGRPIPGNAYSGARPYAW